ECARQRYRVVDLCSRVNAEHAGAHSPAGCVGNTLRPQPNIEMQGVATAGDIDNDILVRPDHDHAGNVVETRGRTAIDRKDPVAGFEACSSGACLGNDVADHVGAWGSE